MTTDLTAPVESPRPVSWGLSRTDADAAVLIPVGDRPLDLPRTVAPLRHGPRDPTFRVDAAGAVWRTFALPAGPGLLNLALTPEGVLARAWGPAADAVIDMAPGVVGATDDVTDFDSSSHPVVHAAARRHAGLRLTRTGLVSDALVAVVLEQKVTSIEAHRSWRELVARFGDDPPGPAPSGMRVAPTPERWTRIPSWEWHRSGVDPRRAATAVGACKLVDRLEAAVGLGSAELDRRLRLLPGIGVWTSAEIRQRTVGDADAVSVGDYNLPALVGWAMTGVRTDDAGMLQLLSKWPGHRHRVTRLLENSGIRVPRRAPRAAIRDYRAI
jgi:3-methyladenine DNA glycosylase/8-oxoguanine DNA glycosylase